MKHSQLPPPQMYVFRVTILEGNACAVNPILPVPRDEVNFHNVYAGKFKYEFAWSQGEKHLFMPCYKTVTKAPNPVTVKAEVAYRLRSQ